MAVAAAQLRRIELIGVCARLPFQIIMRSINGVSALAAVLVVVAYLVARPHIGTVWYVKEDYLGPLATPTASPPSWLIPPPPGFGRPPPLPPRPPTTRFVDKRDCFAAEDRFRNSTGYTLEELEAQHSPVRDAYCATENALLWGW